ncbi:hypothetical protein [Streptomyces sp. NPDC006739]|uniref:hypothetical protein n=1 Tax=Streptomyces sp. NPDC006739 TaxID=3364763 RepID=UPI0036940465
MARPRSLWLDYWPLAVLPVAAGAMDLFLWWRGEPWSWSDWASSFGLGAVTTMVVGMLLARRQGNIQEALADLELTEKVAMLTFSVSHLRESCVPARTYRTLYDCRAGLSLVPLARQPMQHEYLRTLTQVLETTVDTLGSSLRSHARWTPEDWSRLVEVVEGLRETARFNARRSMIMADHWSGGMDARTRDLLRIATGPVPFDVFRAHFTAGADRIRTALDWEALSELAGRDNGTVRLAMVSTDLAPYTLATLEGYHAPWYRDGSGSGSGEVGYDHQDAVPLRHTELATDVSVLQDDRRSRIGVLRDHYAARFDGQDRSLILATYALGPDRFLVLDGNHRLTALTQLVAQGCPARLVEFRLTAPVDSAILPDLIHYEAG